MTDLEQRIAEIALRSRARTDEIQLANDIAADASRAGLQVTPEEVSSTLSELLEKSILRLSVKGARNVAAGEPSQGYATAWYEKGMDWPS
jgi:hypothetical protein